MLLNTATPRREFPFGEKMRMHAQVIGVLTAVLLAGPGWIAEASAQGPGGFEDSGPPPSGSESKSPSKPARVRKKYTIQLPDQYRSKDADKDGQIGLYEWPRSDYATFRRLDVNGDGFLTPKELVQGPSKRKPGGSSSSGAGGRFSRTARSSPSSTDDTPVISKSNVEAERFFDLLDKDKNGKITEEEFKKSFTAPKKFSDAGVALTFPVGKEEFIRLYPAKK